MKPGIQVTGNLSLQPWESIGFTGSPGEFIRIWCEIFTENSVIGRIDKGAGRTGA